MAIFTTVCATLSAGYDAAFSTTHFTTVIQAQLSAIRTAFNQTICATYGPTHLSTVLATDMSTFFTTNDSAFTSANSSTFKKTKLPAVKFADIAAL